MCAVNWHLGGQHPSGRLRRADRCPEGARAVSSLWFTRPAGEVGDQFAGLIVRWVGIVEGSEK